MQIKCVNAPVAAGKTHAAIDHAAKHARHGAKFLIIQPSTDLIDQTMRDFAARHPTVKVTVYHGKNCDRPTREIIRHSKESPGDRGEVLLITHAAYYRVHERYFHRSDRWNLIIDEIPAVDWVFDRPLAYTHHLLTDLCSMETYDAAHLRIVPSDRSGLEQIIEGRLSDDVYSHFFADPACRILSDHWEVFALDSQVLKLKCGESEDGKLTLFGIMSPDVFSGWRSVTIMGAGFKESMLYRHWSSKHGVRFIKHREISARLRFQTPPNGELVTYWYASDEPWSKSYAAKMVDGEKSNLTSVIENAVKLFDGAEYAFMCNKSVDGGLFPGGTQLPNNPHGRNDFQHLHNCLITSALNPSTIHFRFLESQNISGIDARTAIFHQAVYQAAGRISVRDLNNRDQKNIVVPDRQIAEWAIKQTPGSTMKPLPGMVMIAKGRDGRNRVHASDAEKKSASRIKIRDTMLIELDMINGSDRGMVSNTETWVSVVRGMPEMQGVPLFVTKPPIGIRGFRDKLSDDVELVQSLHGLIKREGQYGPQFFSSIYRESPFYHLEYQGNEQFIAYLRSIYQDNTPAIKADNFLMSAAFFDSTTTNPDGTSRGLANIRSMFGVFLDNDGDGIGHEDFAALFPQWRVVVWNSFSSTRQSPRYRVFIPTTALMSQSVYRHIIATIMAKLNRNGYASSAQISKGGIASTKKPHGFDTGKFTPSSLFYAPCQAPDPSDSFFHDYADDLRQSVDPYHMVSRSIVHQAPDPEPSEPVLAAPLPTVNGNASPTMQALQEALHAERMGNAENRRETIGQAARNEFRMAGRGQGNAAFFAMAGKLHRAGLSEAEARSVLESEANSARSRSERRKQIGPILKTFWRHG